MDTLGSEFRREEVTAVLTVLEPNNAEILTIGSSSVVDSSSTSGALTSVELFIDGSKVSESTIQVDRTERPQWASTSVNWAGSLTAGEHTIELKTGDGSIPAGIGFCVLLWKS